MPITYISFLDDESAIGPARWYFELADDGVPLRQMLISTLATGALGEDDCIASNFEHEEHGFFLAEGAIPPDLAAESDALSDVQFDAAWARILAFRQPEWSLAKREHIKGSPLRGVLQVHFPQGPLVAFEDGVLGVIIAGPALESTRIEVPVTAVVDGYDEKHQWLLLRDAQEQAPPRQTRRR